MGYFRFFFTDRTFFSPCTLPYAKKKKLTKNPSNYYLWKVKKFYGDSVTNESARGKKIEGGAKRPPPAFIGLNNICNVPSNSCNVQGEEDGEGTIGNILEAEFKKGRIEGHGVILH